MKVLIIFLSLVFMGCVTSGVNKDRAIANVCHFKNYIDFISKEGVHNCYLSKADLRRADLQNADLRSAYLSKADLRRAGVFIIV